MGLADLLAEFNIQGQAWRRDAACRYEPKETFFPPKGIKSWRAVAICAGCPVQEECLDFALSNHERYGVWAGMGDKDLRDLRDQRRCCPGCGTEFRNRNSQTYCTPDCGETARRRQAAERAASARYARSAWAGFGGNAEGRKRYYDLLRAAAVDSACMDDEAPA